MLPTSIHQHALDTAARGYRVFPIAPDGTPFANCKKPACKHGFKDGTTKPETINGWWGKNPKFNLAVATGGVLNVLDLDFKTGGLPPWPEPPRWTEHPFVLTLSPEELRDLESAIIQTTPQGYHFFFGVGPEGSFPSRAGELCKGADTRGTDGYIVISPTTICGGHEYNIGTTDNLLPPVALLPVTPAWLCKRVTAALAAKKKAPRKQGIAPAFPRPMPSTAPAPGELHPYVKAVLDEECARVRNATPGTGHAALVAAAAALGGWVAGGVLPEAVMRNALTSATLVRKDRDSVEIEAALDWGLAAGAENPRTVPESDRAGRAGKRASGAGSKHNGRARVRCMADVAPETVDWVWENRIPLRMLSLVAGHPGCGKSFFALDAATRISCGKVWPDGVVCPSGGVLLVMEEDSPGHTIRRRLDAAGGDLSRINIMEGMDVHDEDGNEVKVAWSMKDTLALRGAIERTPDCRLVVIDPIGSYVGGETDTTQDNVVRAKLFPLVDLASETGVAILLVAHTRKSAGGRADDQVMGSRAFTGVVRSVLHLVADPEDETGARRLLAPGKMNLCAPPPTLAFTLQPPPDDLHGIPHLQWDSTPINRTADQILSPKRQGPGRPSKQGEARDFLQNVLYDGPLPATEVMTKAKAAGFSERTIDGVKRDLGIKSVKEGDVWMWQLPAQEAADDDY